MVQNEARQIEPHPDPEINDEPEELLYPIPETRFTDEHEEDEFLDQIDEELVEVCEKAKKMVRSCFGRGGRRIKSLALLKIKGNQLRNSKSTHNEL